MTPRSTLGEGRRCLERLALKMARGVLCSIFGKEVNNAMEVIRVTAVASTHTFVAAPGHSRRRHDVQGAHLMASQVACLRRSLNSLPTKVSLTTSLLLFAVDVVRNAEEEYGALRLKKNVRGSG